MDHPAPASPPSPIPWHPAFVQAIKLEREPYKDALEFVTEYQLTSEPLEIDVVIVKKKPALIIEKNIARIFKRVNILEYKSPDDYFAVEDFYKVLSYGYLYAALNKTRVQDMTLTVIETRHSRNLFKYLKEEENREVSETSPGIYRITGYTLEIQVIESKKLPLEENLWLKGLAKDLNAVVAGTILRESWKRGKGAELGAYIYALIQGNPRTLREVVAMSETEIPFDELMEEIGLAAKWEARGEAIGKKNGWEKAITLLKQGYTVEQLEQMSPLSPSPAS
jgi:hypothetical protein